MLYKSIVFVIGDGTIEIPEVKLEYTYTGDTIIFVPEDGAYTVVNRAKKDVGTYKVVLTPNKGYRLSNGKADTTFVVVIKPIMVEKPVLQLEYTYNKKIIDFKFSSSSRNDFGIFAGNYSDRNFILMSEKYSCAVVSMKLFPLVAGLVVIHSAVSPNAVNIC